MVHSLILSAFTSLVQTNSILDYVNYSRITGWHYQLGITLMYQLLQKLQTCVQTIGLPYLTISSVCAPPQYKSG